jgi:hypothetical protein
MVLGHDFRLRRSGLAHRGVRLWYRSLSRRFAGQGIQHANTASRFARGLCSIAADGETANIGSFWSAWTTESERILHRISPYRYGATVVKPAIARRYGMTSVRWNGDCGSR